MRLSEANRRALYNCIANPIMDLRVSLLLSNEDTPKLDEQLFDLEKHIAAKVFAMLRLEENKADKDT